ncbi:MAG TPA: hypothetical protein VEJ84_07255 [Acidimicrobiales bacterium]|nr:hypothetical protein [Acidimicrobiales bacterium]
MANSTSSSGARTAPDLGPAALVYIEKVREATRRLSARQVEPDNVRGSLVTLRDMSNFDAEVPTASNRREWEYLKKAVKRLTVWYMRYMAEQLNAFAASAVRLGDALAAKTEELESVTEDLAVRMTAAEARLRRLETASGHRTARTRRTTSNGRPVEAHKD